MHSATNSAPVASARCHAFFNALIILIQDSDSSPTNVSTKQVREAVVRRTGERRAVKVIVKEEMEASSPVNVEEEVEIMK